MSDERQQEHDLIYCFNPYCLQSSSRVFKKSSASFIRHLSSCHKWILDKNTAELLLTNQVNLMQNQKNGSFKQINFYSSPLKALNQFLMTRQNTKLKISEIYEKLTQFVINKVNSLKICKLQQFDRLNQDVQKFMQTIINNVSGFYIQNASEQENIMNLISQKISFQLNSNLNDISTFKDFKIFDQCFFQSQKQKIRLQIQKLHDNILSEKVFDSQYSQLKYWDMIQVQKIYKNQRGNSHMLLNNLFGWQQQHYFDEKIINGRHIYQINCPLCDHKMGFPSQLKRKKILSQKHLLEHMLSNHLEYTTLNYNYRISRQAVQELPLDYVFFLMQKHSYKQIHIYDGSNTKTSVLHQPNVLTIFLISENNKSSSIVFKYLIAKTPEEAAYIIITIFQIVCRKLEKGVKLFNFKKNYYSLIQTAIQVYKLPASFQQKKNQSKIVLKQSVNKQDSLQTKMAKTEESQ